MTLDLKYDLEIITSKKDFNKMVLTAIRDELNQVLPKAAKVAENIIKNRITPIFTKSPEYEALVQGPLDAHFGIPKGEAIDRLDEIINVLADSIVVTHTKTSVRGDNLTGGLTVKAFRADFEDILNLPAAVVNTQKGQVLPWLEWLLLQGDAIIITEHEIEFGSFNNSRSGAAIMINNKSGVWRVPPGASGTLRNNWITRAVNNSARFLENFINAAIEQSINRVL